MGLFGWFKPKRQPPPEVVMARQLAESISAKATAVQKQLSVYADSGDPFETMIADLKKMQTGQA